MKKLLLAILLLVVVVVISYIKAVRSQSNEETLRQATVRQIDDSLATARSETEALRQVLAIQDSIYADSMQQLRAATETRIDSLKAAIDSSRLSAAVEKVETEEVSPQSDQELATAKREQEILAYYKKRFRDLPNDLTEYERNAATTEIRVESAEEFNISVAKLNRIRKRHGVKY